MSDVARPIGLGSDHAGLRLKEQLKALLDQRGERYEDVGTLEDRSCDYPDFAHRVATGVAEGRYRLGVLVCGTGIGMSMAANRHAGVRAALCTESFAARMSREHNDANVLCIGARIVGAGVAEDILRAFLDSSFQAGRHAARITKIESGGSV